MINVSRVIKDTRFTQDFNLVRKEGKFIKGRFEEVEVQISLSGIIKPSSAKEIEMIPEGDRILGGEITIHTLSELKITNKDGTSDEVLWNGERYKLYAVFPYKDYGFYKAIAIRKESA